MRRNGVMAPRLSCGRQRTAWPGWAERRSRGDAYTEVAMSITVKLPEDVAALLSEEAARQSMTPDELAARVLAEHIPGRRHLGFVAIGESTSGRTAVEAEEMLAEGFGR